MTQETFGFEPDPIRPERIKADVATSGALAFLLEKWRLWAVRRGIALQGSQGDGRGAQVYCKTLEANLYEPLMPEAHREFQEADGQELRTSKARALHSSSMAFVNATHHLRRVGRLDLITEALRVPSAPIASFVYEAKLPIDARFASCPNLDGLFTYRPGRGRLACVAIEAKLTEPLGREHGGFPAKYLAVPRIWAGLPNLRRLAEQIAGEVDPSFSLLYAKQVMLHTVALNANAGPGRWRLVLLHLDLPGACGVELRREIADFARVADADLGPGTFTAVTYQAYILRLARHRAAFPELVDYLAERYL